MSKATPHTGSHAINMAKGKDKGKGKQVEPKKSDGWRVARKTIAIKQRPLQSRNWDASAPSPGQASTSAQENFNGNWVSVVKTGIPTYDDNVPSQVLAATGQHDPDTMADA